MHTSMPQVLLLNPPPMDGCEKGRGGQDQRSSYEEVLLTHRLAEAVRRINPTVPPATQEEAIKEFNVSIRLSY